MVPGFSSVHLPSLQPRDHPPRLRGEVVEPAAVRAIRVVRCRLVECEGMASRLDAVALIGAPERCRPPVDVAEGCDTKRRGAPEVGVPAGGGPGGGAGGGGGGGGGGGARGGGPPGGGPPGGGPPGGWRPGGRRPRGRRHRG